MRPKVRSTLSVFTSEKIKKKYVSVQTCFTFVDSFYYNESLCLLAIFSIFLFSCFTGYLERKKERKTLVTWKERKKERKREKKERQKDVHIILYD